MNAKHSPKAPGFLSIFLITVMVTVEILTLAVLWLLQLSVPVLMIAGSLMVLADTAIFRMIFRKKTKALRISRFMGGMLTLCTTAVCLAGSIGALLLGGSLSSMFGNAAISGTAPTPQNPASESFAVYLSGSDTRGSSLTKSRSDVNIIAVVDPVNNQLLLVNTPRDYYVSNPAGRGAKDKLAHCGLYGTDNSRQALAALYDVFLPN